MANEQREKCIDGSLYHFVPAAPEISGAPGGGIDVDTGTIEEYLSAIVELLTPLYDYYSGWTGTITPYAFVVPANSQKKHYQIFPAARTIRIECDVSAMVWLNSNSGVPIPIGADRKVVSLNNLPPQAAVHDIYVTCEPEARIMILGVS